MEDQTITSTSALMIIPILISLSIVAIGFFSNLFRELGPFIVVLLLLFSFSAMGLAVFFCVFCAVCLFFCAEDEIAAIGLFFAALLGGLICSTNYLMAGSLITGITIAIILFVSDRRERNKKRFRILGSIFFFVAGLSLFFVN